MGVKIGVSGGYLGVVVPNRPNAVCRNRIPRDVPEVWRARRCARQSLLCYAMCTCNVMERHACMAVTARRGGFEVLEGAMTTISMSMNQLVEKVRWKDSYGSHKCKEISLVER